MLDFVHVAGLDKKAQQPDPAVNAVKAKTKAEVTASKAKTEVNKAKVKKASSARNSKQLMSLGCLLGVLGGLGRALLDVPMRYTPELEALQERRPKLEQPKTLILQDHFLIPVADPVRSSR